MFSTSGRTAYLYQSSTFLESEIYYSFAFLHIQDINSRTSSAAEQGTSLTNGTTLYSLIYILYSTCQWGEKNNGFSPDFGLIKCSCKVEKVTHTAADSLVWLSALAVDLIAQHINTMTLFSVQFTRGCLGALNLKVSSHTDHSFPILTIARTYPPLNWRSWTAFHFPLSKKSEMLSQLVIESTPIRALMKQWLTFPGWSWTERSVILVFVPLPFSRSTF